MSAILASLRSLSCVVPPGRNASALARDTTGHRSPGADPDAGRPAPYRRDLYAIQQ
ncbi:hypothetical protein [Streptomyces sp. NPDC059247]|uniref:hypothetical protein n=1 Tax=Streptomyces sp. NPDC059247 TaxID=3346790 RepID=UPI003685B738